MTQDYYETLQVHPRADATAIEAAYARLRELYDPARLDGAADELVDLARAKRDAIERAYAVLSDPARRAAYDQEQDALADERRRTKDEGRRCRISLQSSVLSPPSRAQRGTTRLPPAAAGPARRAPTRL